MEITNHFFKWSNLIFLERHHSSTFLFCFDFSDMYNQPKFTMKVPELLKMREITSGSIVLMSLRHRPPKIEQVLPQDKWKYLRTYRYRQDIKISIVLKIVQKLNARIYLIAQQKYVCYNLHTEANFDLWTHQIGEISGRVAKRLEIHQRLSR